eukprot:SAG11_NODE_15550_length_574_cov_1.155789_1_plen_59_part_00
MSVISIYSISADHLHDHEKLELMKKHSKTEEELQVKLEEEEEVQEKLTCSSAADSRFH